MDWKSIRTDAANIDLEMKRRQAEALKQREIEEELARKRREAAYEDELRPYKLEEAKAQFEDAKQGRSEKAEAKRKKEESDALGKWMIPETTTSEDGMTETTKPPKEQADIAAETMARQVVAPFATVIAQQIISQLSNLPGIQRDTAAGKAYKSEKGKQKAVLESIKEQVGMGARRDFSKAAPSGTGRSGGGKQPAAGKRRGLPADVSESWDGTTEQVRPTSGATDLMAAISSLGAAPGMGQPAFEGLSGSLQAADPKLERQTVLGKQEEAPYKKALAAWEQSVAGFKRQIMSQAIRDRERISDPDAHKLAEQMAGPRPKTTEKLASMQRATDVLGSLEPGAVFSSPPGVPEPAAPQPAPAPTPQTQPVTPPAPQSVPLPQQSRSMKPSGNSLLDNAITPPFQQTAMPTMPQPQMFPPAGMQRPSQEPPIPDDPRVSGMEDALAIHQQVSQAMQVASQAYTAQHGTPADPAKLQVLEKVLRDNPDLPFGQIISRWIDQTYYPKMFDPAAAYVELNSAVRDSLDDLSAAGKSMGNAMDANKRPIAPSPVVAPPASSQPSMANYQSQQPNLAALIKDLAPRKRR